MEVYRLVNGTVQQSDRGPQGRPRGVARGAWTQAAPIVAGFLIAVLFLVAGAIAYARWRQGRFDWPLIAQGVRSLEWGWLGAAVALTVVSYVVRALRWGALLASVKSGVRLGTLLSATAIGFSAVLLLGRAGEVVRPYMIARKERVSLSSQLGVWLLERLLDLLAALLFLGYALGHWRSQGWSMEEGLRAAGWGMLLAACAGIAAVIVIAIRPDWAEGRVLGALEGLPWAVSERIRGGLLGFLRGLGGVRSASVLSWVLLYTLLEWAVIAGCCWCFFKSSPWTRGFGLGDVLLFLGVVSFGSLLQAPGIGGGIQASATVVLTEVYRVPVEVSVGLAFALWAITFVVVLPFGVGYGLREGVNWITIRKVSEQVSA